MGKIRGELGCLAFTYSNKRDADEVGPVLVLVNGKGRFLRVKIRAGKYTFSPTTIVMKSFPEGCSIRNLISAVCGRYADLPSGYRDHWYWRPNLLRRWISAMM